MKAHTSLKGMSCQQSLYIKALADPLCNLVILGNASPYLFASSKCHLPFLSMKNS